MKDKISIDIIMLSRFNKNDGGKETWLYNFLPELLKRENIEKVNVFGFRTEEEKDNSILIEELDPLNKDRIKVFLLEGKKRRSPRFFSMLCRLRNHLGHKPMSTPDITLAVGGLFEVSLMLLNKRFRSGTTVAWLRSIFTHEKAYRIPRYARGVIRGIEYHLLKQVDIVIANGNDTKRYYENYGLNVRAIPNAVYIDQWEMPELVFSDILEVAYIGRLSQVKGIERYLELATEIKSGPLAEQFRFHIVGEANKYEKQVKKLSSKGFVVYHGPINNECLPEFLPGIQICVALTYVSQNGGGGGVSNALLEQMAAGKIIIAWNNEAFNQILDDNCAYIVEQNSMMGLKKSLLTILRNQREAINKGKAAKEKVRPYNMPAHVEKFMDVIKEI